MDTVDLPMTLDGNKTSILSPYEQRKQRKEKRKELRDELLKGMLQHLQKSKDVHHNLHFPKRPSDWQELSTSMESHPHLNTWEALVPLLYLLQEKGALNQTPHLKSGLNNFLKSPTLDIHGLTALLMPFEQSLWDETGNRNSLESLTHPNKLTALILNLLEDIDRLQPNFEWHCLDREGLVFFEHWKNLIDLEKKEERMMIQAWLKRITPPPSPNPQIHKIYTTEDPPEYDIPGAGAIPVVQKKDINGVAWIEENMPFFERLVLQSKLKRMPWGGLEKVERRI